MVATYTLWLATARSAKTPPSDPGRIVSGGLSVLRRSPILPSQFPGRQRERVDVYTRRGLPRELERPGLREP
jgi:hypothetical protein